MVAAACGAVPDDAAQPVDLPPGDEAAADTSTSDADVGGGGGGGGGDGGPSDAEPGRSPDVAREPVDDVSAAIREWAASQPVEVPDVGLGSAAAASDEAYWLSLGFEPDEIPLVDLLPYTELPLDVQLGDVVPVERSASRVLGPKGPGCDDVVALDPRNGDAADPGPAVRTSYRSGDLFVSADLTVATGLPSIGSADEVLAALDACGPYSDDVYEISTEAVLVGHGGDAVVYRVDHVPLPGVTEYAQFAEVVGTATFDGVRVHSVAAVVSPDALPDAYVLTDLLVGSVADRLTADGVVGGPAD